MAVNGETLSLKGGTPRKVTAAPLYQIKASDLSKNTPVNFLRFSCACMAKKNIQEPVSGWQFVKR